MTKKKLINEASDFFNEIFAEYLVKIHCVNCTHYINKTCKVKECKLWNEVFVEHKLDNL